MSKPKLIAVLSCILSVGIAGSQEPPSIFLDGEWDMIESGSYTTITLLNGATALTVGGIEAKTVLVDRTSTIEIGALMMGPFTEFEPDGSGGAYGGRGGGPLGNVTLHGTPDDIELSTEYGVVPAPLYGAPGNQGKIYTKVCTGTDVRGGEGGFAGGTLAIFADSVIIDGTVEANGGEGHFPWPLVFDCYPWNNYAAGYGGGGGSGGCVLLVARTLRIGPSAVIVANGGEGCRAEDLDSRAMVEAAGA